MSFSPYLSGLLLAQRLVILVGGGNVAQRRIPAFIDAGARIRVISPDVTPTVEGWEKSGHVEWLRRPYAEGDLDEAWYVVTATDDAEVNREVARAAEARRLFCVRSDMGHAGSAVTPATASANGAVVGVTTGGDIARSKSIRAAVAEVLAHEPRAAAHGGPNPRAGTVALIGGGPGDPDLMTIRGRYLISQADVIVVDRLAPQHYVASARADVEIIDAAKLPYGRAMEQEAINAALITAARAGKFVVRLKGGDPFLFGRGFEEVQALTAAQIPVTVVPGISSALGVPTAASVPVTHRGVAHEVVVVTGHVAPGDARSLVDWAALGRLRGSIVALMAVTHAGEIARVLIEHGRAPDTAVVVLEQGTLPHERATVTTLSGLAAAIAAAEIKAPAIIVIGQVAGLAPTAAAAQSDSQEGRL